MSIQCLTLGRLSGRRSKKETQASPQGWWVLEGSGWHMQPIGVLLPPNPHNQLRLRTLPPPPPFLRHWMVFATSCPHALCPHKCSLATMFPVHLMHTTFMSSHSMLARVSQIYGLVHALICNQQLPLLHICRLSKFSLTITA